MPRPLTAGPSYVGRMPRDRFNHLESHVSFLSDINYRDYRSFGAKDLVVEYYHDIIPGCLESRLIA